MVLYPMFVHMYLELVYKGSEKEGKTSNIIILVTLFIQLLDEVFVISRILIKIKVTRLCSSGAWWSLVPNSCSQKIKKDKHSIAWNTV